jgi:hypothetical protein
MAHNEFLADFATAHRGVRIGHLFGAPAIYAGRRVFARMEEDRIIVKLPDDLVRREIARGATPHLQRGRRIRGWVTYRPRTVFEARRLWPILEVAARSAADLA